jgi:glutamyl-tRNA synthetase
MSVRVRYAPSPTGSPHVGNIRTALYNHLFALKHRGTNVLRIEDTDRARTVPGCEDEIIESLRYVGVAWQEGPDVGGPHGPYRQSDRQAAGVYQPYIERLLDSGAAYWAFETPEELAAMRDAQAAAKEPVGYFGGVWRDAQASQVEAAHANGKPGVLRLRLPRGTNIVVEDTVRGRIETASDLVDDPVLIKADGMPTYHFAAMVDDHLMGITHVFRGEEWISSAPKHVVLFQALGWEPPVFVHLPVIKGKDGSKLSKRHGDTACLDFRRAGYLGEALANFIALIGWSPGGDREVMTMDEMAEAFDLRGIQPSSGVFDIEKLRWMNGQWLRGLDESEFFGRAAAYSASDEAAEYWRAHGEPERAVAVAELGARAAADPAYVARATALLQERVETLADVGPAAREKWLTHAHVPELFDRLVDALETQDRVWDEEACEALVREVATSLGLDKLGPAVHPVRVALTGSTTGPGLWELMAVLGPLRMAARLRSAVPK